MIKRLLVGAALGVWGKKLYDEGRLDPYIAKAKSKVDSYAGTDTAAAGPAKAKPATTPAA